MIRVYPWHIKFTKIDDYKERSAALQHFKKVLDEKRDQFTVDQFEVISAIYGQWTNLSHKVHEISDYIFEKEEYFVNTVMPQYSAIDIAISDGKMTTVEGKAAKAKLPSSAKHIEDMKAKIEEAKDAIDEFWAYKDTLLAAVKEQKAANTTALTVNKQYNSAEEAAVDELTARIMNGEDPIAVMADIDSREENSDITNNDTSVNDVADIKVEAENNNVSVENVPVEAVEDVVEEDKTEESAFSLFSAVPDSKIVEKAVSWIVKTVKETVNKVVETVEKVTDKVISAVKDTVVFVTKKVKDFGRSVKNFGSSLFGKISSFSLFSSVKLQC